MQSRFTVRKSKRKINEQKLLLSPTEIIVLDEAHNLEIKARNSYKKVLTFSNVSSIINKSYRLLSKVGYPIYSSEISELNEKIKEFFGIVKQQAEKQINILIKKITENSSSKLIENIETEKGKLKSKMNKLIDLSLENAVDRETFLERKEKIQNQIEQLNLK